MTLQPSLTGSSKHAQQCGLVDATTVLASRLEVVSETPLTIRAGVECVGVESILAEFNYGNVWLDPAYSIPFALSVFSPSNHVFEGHIIVPSLTETCFDKSQTCFQFTTGISVGRLISIREGNIKALSVKSDSQLPAGEHLLQLSASARIRDDSSTFRTGMRRDQNGDKNCDDVHCRSESLRIHIRPNGHEVALKTVREDPFVPELKCTLRFVGQSPTRVGDPATIEVILDNLGTRPLKLVGPCFGLGVSGWAPLIRQESAGESQMKWDLSCLSEAQLFRKGGVECFGKKPSGFQVTIPANGFIGSKFYIPEWNLAGDYTLKVQYSNSLLLQNYPETTDIDDPRLPRPCSNTLSFRVSE